MTKYTVSTVNCDTLQEAEEFCQKMLKKNGELYPGTRIFSVKRKYDLKLKAVEKKK